MNPAAEVREPAQPPRAVAALPGFERAGRKVVRATELARLLQAQDVLEQARREAETLQEQIPKIHAEARRLGHEAGRSAAYQATLADLQRQAATLAQAWGADRRALAGWVVQAVEQVLHGHVAPRERYEALLEAAMQALGDASPLSIHVPAADAATVGASLQALAERLPGAERLRVVADAAVRPGSCILQTSTGYLDVGLGVQLESLRQLLLEGAAESPSVKGRGDG